MKSLDKKNDESGSDGCTHDVTDAASLPLVNQSEIGVGNTKLPLNRSNQLIYWFFTYNNYTEEKVETLLTTFNKICKAYVFQSEVGKDGTPHLQGVIRLWKKMRWSEFSLPKEIHWEKVKDVKSAFLYCAKDDTFTGKRWVYPENLIKDIIAGEKKNMELRVIQKLRPWQQSVLNSLQEDPDDRSINWIYDEHGCAGKTVFAKYLVSKERAIVATGGGNKDIACLLAILVEAGRDLNDRTSFIFNFPRSTEGISYKAIESVKDGLMTSVKYESSTLVFNCPHVWCFSNEMPDLNKLSADRWRLWTIKDDALVSLNGNDSGSESPEEKAQWKHLEKVLDKIIEEEAAEVNRLLAVTDDINAISIRNQIELERGETRTQVEHKQGEVLLASSELSQVELDDDSPDNIVVSDEEIANYYSLDKYFIEKNQALDWCNQNCNKAMDWHRRNCQANIYPGGS